MVKVTHSIWLNAWHFYFVANSRWLYVYVRLSMCDVYVCVYVKRCRFLFLSLCGSLSTLFHSVLFCVEHKELTHYYEIDCLQNFKQLNGLMCMLFFPYFFFIFWIVWIDSYWNQILSIDFHISVWKNINGKNYKNDKFHSILVDSFNSF